MGISPAQFWAQSQNGKAMLTMLAQRNNPEVVRDICEWLVGVYEKDLQAGAIERGASMEQAKVYAHNNAAQLYSQVYSINERNQVQAAQLIVDQVFARHYQAGQQHYASAQAWFANELRKRFKNDDER